MNRVLIGCALALTFACASAAMAQTPPPARPPAGPAFAPARIIEPVTGDIFRAGNGNWWSLFAVTKAGIILVDPISPDFAKWLKAQLDQRYPGVPVRYVIYSHSHWDHIEGGAVFKDTALFVAQDGMRRNMDGRYPHMPGDMIDRNANGTIEPEEIRIPSDAHPGVCGMPDFWFAHQDRNGDGHITPAELYADVVLPDITYTDRMTLSLGGMTVQLIFPGKNHADDGTVVYFPAEKVVFSVDFPADALVSTSMRSLPSACGAFDQHPLSEWIASYRAIEALDFDILAQGHGRVLFHKADVTEGREYFEYLRDQVLDGMRAGKSLDELRRTLMLEKYKDWAGYDQRRVMNIEAAYQNLSIYK
ncbi:MAG TPA: MBL fold metallo-hydrolase [Opitutaceae bacterium]|nr:MBL fold metallo-hydrolase [Opitutaceae bacterium]